MQAHYRLEDYESAVADFSAVLRVDAENKAARQQLVIASNQLRQQRLHERQAYAGMFDRLAKVTPATWHHVQLARIRPITERMDPQLIPVLGSRPAGDASHKPGGRLPLLFTMPAVTLATLKFRCLVNRDLTGVNSLPKTKFA